MFEMLKDARPGVLSPETRKAVIKSSVSYVADELRAMPALLQEMPADELARLEAALMEAQGSIDVFKEHRPVITDERFTELVNGPLAHPLGVFRLTRLAHALRAVVEATGERGRRALEDHCAARDEQDRMADREPDEHATMPGAA